MAGARLLWVRDRSNRDAKPDVSPCRCADDRGGRSRGLGVDGRADRHRAPPRKRPTSVRRHRRDACSHDYYEHRDAAGDRRLGEPRPAELRVGDRVCGAGHTRLAAGGGRNRNRMCRVRAVVDHRERDGKRSRVSCAAGRSSGGGHRGRGVTGGRNSSGGRARRVRFPRNAQFVAGRNANVTDRGTRRL